MDTPDDARLNPTDRVILEVLTNGKRQTSSTLAALTDNDRGYVTNKVSRLVKHGYASRPGPPDCNRMVEITDTGHIAVSHFDDYISEYADVFFELCQREGNTTTDNPPGQDGPDLTELEQQITDAMSRMNGVTIPTHLADELPGDVDVDTVGRRLYALYFHGIVDRHEGMDAYTLSDTGKSLAPKS